MRSSLPAVAEVAYCLSLGFLVKMREPLLVAFDIVEQHLPVTLRTVEHKLGVRNNVASFVALRPPSTWTACIMQGVATVFIAQFYGIDLGLWLC